MYEKLFENAQYHSLCMLCGCNTKRYLRQGSKQRSILFSGVSAETCQGAKHDPSIWLQICENVLFITSGCRKYRRPLRVCTFTVLQTYSIHSCLVFCIYIFLRINIRKYTRILWIRSRKYISKRSIVLNFTRRDDENDIFTIFFSSNNY